MATKRGGERVRVDVVTTAYGRAALSALGLRERVDSWVTALDDLPFDSGIITKLRRVVEYRRRRLAPGR